jgi:hypothetical protein
MTTKMEAWRGYAQAALTGGAAPGFAALAADSMVEEDERRFGPFSEQPMVKRGRPKSSQAEARERAAAALGVSAEALRKQEERARKRTPMPPPLEPDDVFDSSDPGNFVEPGDAGDELKGDVAAASSDALNDVFVYDNPDYDDPYGKDDF